MDLSKISTADLEALQAGDLSKVSTNALQALAGADGSSSPSAVPSQSAAVASAPPASDGLGRQLGLTARYAIEGPAQALSVFTEPIRQYVTDPLLRKLSPQSLPDLVTNAKRESPSVNDMAHQLADWMGLPSPQSPFERVVGDVTRTGFGAMGMGGLASKFTSTPSIADQSLIQPGIDGMRARMAALPQATVDAFGTNMPLQVTSAAGAGGAGGIARENGIGPVGQTVASLAGGIALPMGAQAIGAAAGKAAQLARSVSNFFTGQDTSPTIEMKLADLLGSRGIDWDSLNGGVAYFSDRGRPFQADRGRCFIAIMDDRGARE